MNYINIERFMFEKDKFLSFGMGMVEEKYIVVINILFTGFGNSI